MPYRLTLKTPEAASTYEIEHAEAVLLVIDTAKALPGYAVVAIVDTLSGAQVEPETIQTLCTRETDTHATAS